MDLVHFQCPSCGAELPPRAPTDEVACEYCGTRFAPERARAAKTSAGQQLDPAALAQLREAHAALAAANRELVAARELADHEAQRAQRESKRANRRKRRIVPRLMSAIGSLIATAVFVAVIAAMLVASGAISIADIPWLRELDLVEQLEAKLDPEGVDAFAGPPMLVEIGGAPAVIVRVREHAEQQLHVDAYMLPSAAGGELERRWRIGPLGSGKQLEHARFTIAGPWVVVSSSGRELYVHELASGTRVRTIELRSEVDYLCTADPEGNTVYVRQSKRHQLLTVATGGLARAAKEPLHCEPWRANDLDASVVALDGVELGDALAGLSAARVLLAPDGVRGAALLGGHRIVGFTEDPDGRRKRNRLRIDAATWTAECDAIEPWPINATLAHDRIVTAWQHTDGTTRVSVHGLDDGALLWSETIAVEDGDRVIALRGGPSHVLVVRTHALDVLDATTGALMASLGEPPT